jgi:TetR/AcrR family transcriptional repressor of multidrug resistance operon
MRFFINKRTFTYLCPNSRIRLRTRDISKQELVKQKAIEMLVSDGFEGFSVNKLAKACDISVATLYIYYKDKDDLIRRIGVEEAKNMLLAIMKNFDPDASFAEGLKLQWKNRAKYMLENQMTAFFFEQLRTSTYQEQIFSTILDGVREPLGRFMHNAIKRGEIDPMPMEVYWSVAFAPLYNLIRFHHEGRSLGGKPFIMNNKMLWQTFDLVLKALKK